MAKPKGKRPAPKKIRRRQRVLLTRKKMTKRESGDGEGQIHLYLDSQGNRKIDKTSAVSGEKPGQHGTTQVEWHITNDWNVSAKVDLVNFKPRYPFNAAGNKPKVAGKGGTETLKRVVGPFSDRDTYSYEVRTTVGKTNTDWRNDPWFILY